MKVGIISLKRKAFLILFDGLKMTLNFLFLLHVLKVSISCFLLWNEIIRENSKQIKIYFLSLTESDVLQVINNLPRNLWYNYQWKKPSKYNDKDATAIKKHNNHQADSFCFTLIVSASNNFRLKLKKYLVILKLKPSFNVAKEPIPLHLFDNDA